MKIAERSRSISWQTLLAMTWRTAVSPRVDSSASLTSSSAAICSVVERDLRLIFSPHTSGDTYSTVRLTEALRPVTACARRASKLAKSQEPTVLTSNADHQPKGGEKACAPIAAPEQRDLLFRPDPLRPVRLLKWGVRLVVFTLILALGPLHNFSLSDSLWDTAGFWITGSFIGMVGIEFAFYHMFRLAKRGAYPSLLATELGAVRDFHTACTTAVESCAPLLNGAAGALFWLATEGGPGPRP